MGHFYSIGCIAACALLIASHCVAAQSKGEIPIPPDTDESVLADATENSTIVVAETLSLDEVEAPQYPAPTHELAAPIVLPAFTPVYVMMDEEVSTEANVKGDIFGITVLHDVMEGEKIVIPAGTVGTGEVTFATGNGGFGKAGIISIALRHIELNDAQFLLDGRYREEGRNNDGLTAATWFAVGIFSGFIRGKDGAIPKGRELKARTGEDIAYIDPANLLPVTETSTDNSIAEKEKDIAVTLDLDGDGIEAPTAADESSDTALPGTEATNTEPNSQ